MPMVKQALAEVTQEEVAPTIASTKSILPIQS
jgi:hypothetical protein